MVPELHRRFSKRFILGGGGRLESGLPVLEAYQWFTLHDKPSVFTLVKSFPDC